MKRGLAIALFGTDKRNSFIFHGYAGTEPSSRKSTQKPQRAQELQESSSLSRSPSLRPKSILTGTGPQIHADAHISGRVGAWAMAVGAWEKARPLHLLEAGSP